MLLCQAMHEVNLGAYGPLASRRRALDLFISVIRGHGVFGIPNYHLLLRYAEFERGVPAQVFVGEEEYALATAECPLDHSGCVRGGADDSAIAPAESFQVGR